MLIHFEEKIAFLSCISLQIRMTVKTLNVRMMVSALMDSASSSVCVGHNIQASPVKDVSTTDV